MNRPELYERSLNILVQAYFNGTLKHAHCGACACGNLIAGNLGAKIYKNGEQSLYLLGGELIRVKWNEWGSHTYPNEPDAKPYHLSATEITGYSPDELAKIEDAFEGFYLEGEDKDYFPYLLSVVDALDEIHENNDQSITQQSKKRFDKSVPLI